MCKDPQPDIGRQSKSDVSTVSLSLEFRESCEGGAEEFVESEEKEDTRRTSFTGSTQQSSCRLIETEVASISLAGVCSRSS